MDLEYPLQEHSLEQAVQRFEEIYQKYHTEGTRAWLSVIPDKNCFLAKQSGHLSMDYAEFEKMMDQKAAFAEYIQISDCGCCKTPGTKDGCEDTSDLYGAYTGSGFLWRILWTGGAGNFRGYDTISDRGCDGSVFCL